MVLSCKVTSPNQYCIVLCFLVLSAYWRNPVLYLFYLLIYLSGLCQSLNLSEITHIQWLIYTLRKYFLGVQIFFSRWTPVRCLYAVLLCWRGSRRHCTLRMFRAGSQVVDHQNILSFNIQREFLKKLGSVVFHHYQTDIKTSNFST